MIRIYDWIEKIAKWLLISSLIVMATINFGNVLSRNVFKASFSFTEELTIGLFVFNTFIAAALAARKGGHLGLTIIFDRLSEANQRILSLLTGIISSGLFGLLAYYGYLMTKSQARYGQMSPALGLPQWIFGSAIPIGAALCMLGFLVGGIEAFKQKGDE
ncbi:TRAP-type C4-dicarboxylate transport system, small permease component [Natronincola peptidivorans]|uniref:TRAP-type C4-dicarboxylate transport system, small permease component n=1 Tax=Natronincola peptidivorans TaxID=426128 RepID=A0A1I0BLN1_9FIRM|nr:TRAP transporter small permease [Natronincola peptidivorans]SET07865.1 TRAP-type C4-dicarboxylate transport system, small permease component [Natronincola peptidivorans]